MNDSYLEVLRQYEGEVTGVRRGRGAWICEYPDGLKLLKEYRGTVKRLEFEDAVLGALEQQGICRTDRYVRNLEDGLVTAGPDGVKYVLKRWFSIPDPAVYGRSTGQDCPRWNGPFQYKRAGPPFDSPCA